MIFISIQILANTLFIFFRIIFMMKKPIATCFIILLMAFIGTPSLLAVVDSSIDTSIFYSFNEEEEKGGETIKTFEILADYNQHHETHIYASVLVRNQGYFFKKYPKPNLNLIFPPPESYIL